MKKRLAAEWEPVKGVMVSWPLLLPHQLIVEFSKDLTTYIIMNEEEDSDSVTEILQSWGADLNHIEFITAPQGGDANWIRDWGPHAVFTETGEYILTSPDYRIYGTPNQGVDPEEAMTSVYTEEILKPHEPLSVESLTGRNIAEHFHVQQQDLHFVMTGGNIMSDGYDNIVSTIILLKENELNGMSSERFFKEVAEKTGMNNYAITPNYEDLGIQHVDCMFKMIDDETFFVARPPKDHKYYERYENIVNNYLSKINTRYGRPFKIKRFDTEVYDGEELAAYSNSIILNDTVYVPLFNIPQDEIVLKQWAEAMPGYTVKGFRYVIAEEPENPMAEMYTDIGWTSGDALHCRTRALWDPDMLYMSVRRIEDGEKDVYANVKDYSGSELKEVAIYHRAKGSLEFTKTVMDAAPAVDYYVQTITGYAEGTEIEYYVQAENKAGNVETMPRTAPKGLYQAIV